MPPNQPEQSDTGVDEVRMSFGDHLDELRRRLIFALIGLAITTVLCFKFGGEIIKVLTTPYYIAMVDQGFNPRMVQLNPIEGFLEYFKIALKFGLLAAAPWMLYQIWGFVATGLFPSERKIVRFFAPTSIALFMTGASFMVIIVLSGLMKFLIGISMWFPMPTSDSWAYRLLSGSDQQTVAVAATRPAEPLIAPILVEEPDAPADGAVVWFNPQTRTLNLKTSEDRYFVMLERASNEQFVQPFFSISEYLGFVTNLALAFGLGFQIPIVVVFLIAMNIFEARDLSGARKYIILGVCILSAILTPTPDIATMSLLAIPMILLFEVGLLVGRIIERRRVSESADG